MDENYFDEEEEDTDIDLDSIYKVDEPPNALDKQHMNIAFVERSLTRQSECTNRYCTSNLKKNIRSTARTKSNDSGQEKSKKIRF